MIEASTYQVTGLLIGLPAGIDKFNWWNSLEEIETKPSTAKEWQKLILRSKDPLAGEFKDSGIDSFPYLYLVRTSGKHALIVSERNKLVEWLLKKINIFNTTTRPITDINRLVNELAIKPSIYALSGVHAKVDGYGKWLQSIALYGDDLSQATLFKQILPEFIPFRVSLKDVKSGKEIISIGTRGEIGFFYSTALEKKVLERVVDALRFLNKENYIDWPDEPPGMDVL